MITRRVKREGGEGGSDWEVPADRKEVSLSDFPDEILEMIIGKVDQYDSKLKLRLVNRRWKRLTDPFLCQNAFSPKWVPFPDIRTFGHEEGVTTFKSAADVKKFMEDMKGGGGSLMVEKNPIPTRRIVIEQDDNDCQSKVIKRSHDLNYVAVPRLFSKYWNTITQVYCYMDSVEVRCGEIARQLCTEVFKQLPMLACLGLEGLKSPEWDADEGENPIGRHLEGNVPHFKYLRVVRVEDHALWKDILMTYGHQLKSLEISECDGLDEYLERGYQWLAARDSNEVAFLPNLEELKLSRGMMEAAFKMVFATAIPTIGHLKRLSIHIGKKERFELDDLLLFIGKFSMTLEDLCLDVYHLSLTEEDGQRIELPEFPVLTKLAISYCLKINAQVWEEMVDKMTFLKELTFLCRKRNRSRRTGPFSMFWNNDIEKAKNGMSGIWNQFPLLQRVRLYKHNIGWEWNSFHDFLTQKDRPE